MMPNMTETSVSCASHRGSSAIRVKRMRSRVWGAHVPRFTGNNVTVSYCNLFSSWHYRLNSDQKLVIRLYKRPEAPVAD